MKHLYKYRLKAFLGDRTNLFWTLAFPLMLSVFFQFSFGSLTGNVENFKTIRVAVVDDGNQPYLTAMLEELSSGENPALEAVYAGRAEAEAMVKNGDAAGAILLDGAPSLFFENTGLEQSILKNILDGYLSTESTIKNIAASDPSKIPWALSTLTGSKQEITHVSLSGGSLDNMLQMFYALIAMTCLYGGFFGLQGAVSVEANLSTLGARRCITPTRKSTMILSDLAAAQTIVFGELCILLLFLRFVLGTQLGKHFPAMLLLCFVGSAVGIMLGMLIGVAVKTSADTKTSINIKDGILIATSLILSFLSGLMYWNMRNIIENSAPIVNRINPAALIVDAFYALDAYGIGWRYWSNLAILAGIAALLCIICTVVLRRKQYASV